MKIKLNEIPNEGRQYTFNRETGELNEVLDDLLADRPYSVELFIKPIGNAFEMTGRVNTMVGEICSRCGWDLDVAIDRKVREILMEEREDADTHRKSQSVHGNHSLDFSSEGPSMTSYRDDVFDVGEFVHELIALEEPFYPDCGDDKCERLLEVQAKQKEVNAEFDKADGTKKAGHPAFAVLQNLEVKKKKQ